MANQPDIKTQLREVVDLIKAGDRTAAREQLSKLMKAYPQNADVFYLASRLAGSPEQREKFLKEALRLNPEHKLAKEQLQTQVPVPPSKTANKSKLNKQVIILSVIAGLVIVVVMIKVVSGVLLAAPYILTAADVSAGITTFNPKGITSSNSGQFKHFRMNPLTVNSLTVSGIDWSLDGQHIACTDQQRNLCTMNSDGTNLHMLGLTGFDPYWSPNNQKIAYLDGAARQWHLYVIDANGSAPIQVSTSIVRDLYFTWSPDSKRLAFSDATDGSLVIAQADGSGSVNIPHGNAPQWSPDGTKLLLSTGDFGISVANSEGSNRVEIGKGRDATWSPDGSKIAFDDDDGIYIMNSDGSNIQTVLYEDSLFARRFQDPVWSPDGQYIAYIYSVRVVQLKIVSVDGKLDYYVASNAHRTSMQRHKLWLPSNVNWLLSGYAATA